jgi:hypothetical protein
MNPTMQIVQEVQLPNRIVVRQVKEVYENGVVGYRIIKSLDLKVINVGGLFDELRSARLFLKATNVPGAVQRI